MTPVRLETRSHSASTRSSRARSSRRSRSLTYGKYQAYASNCQSAPRGSRRARHRAVSPTRSRGRAAPRRGPAPGGRTRPPRWRSCAAPLPERVVADADDRQRRHRPPARICCSAAGSMIAGRPRLAVRQPRSSSRAPARPPAAPSRPGSSPASPEPTRAAARGAGRREGTRRWTPANWHTVAVPIGRLPGQRDPRCRGHHDRQPGHPERVAPHRSSKTSTDPVAGDPDPPRDGLVGDPDGVVAGVDRLEDAHVRGAELADRAALVVHHVERAAVGRDVHAPRAEPVRTFATAPVLRSSRATVPSALRVANR